MNAGLRRCLILITVFVAAFLSVFVILKLRKGYTLADILSGRANGPTHRSEKYTLKERPALELDDVKVLAAINSESAAIVRAVVPSVVSIDTTGVRHERLRDLFGRTWLRPREVQGQGSGVIVTEEGHVLTNYHVVQGNPRIRLTMHDGSVHSAKVIGLDPAVDIAVLKIDSKGPFTPLSFGDSSKIEVGHIVFAIGSPFGLGESVTDGKISAKKRSFTDSQVDLLQTSAAINPGNSGGPLVNIQGEIIGINSRIYSTDKKNPGFQGIGFAIPSNAAKKTMEDILERGRPIRGYLGMALANLDVESRKEFNFSESDGVRVRGVVPDSPAEKAGLKKDDIVTRFRGEKVNGMRRLIALVQQSTVGAEIPLEIWREGAVHTITATVGEAAEFTRSIDADPPANDNRRLDNTVILNAIGLAVRNLNTFEKNQGLQGVIVVNIMSHSKLRRGLRPGDLIRAINGSPVGSKKDFLARLAASAAVQNTDLFIQRNQRSFHLTLSPVKAK